MNDMSVKIQHKRLRAEFFPNEWLIPPPQINPSDTNVYTNKSIIIIIIRVAIRYIRAYGVNAISCISWSSYTNPHVQLLFFLYIHPSNQPTSHSNGVSISIHHFPEKCSRCITQLTLTHIHKYNEYVYKMMKVQYIFPLSLS